MGDGFETAHAPGEPGHVALHNAIGARFNAASHVNDPKFTSIQDALDQCKTLHFPPGEYTAGQLVINHDIHITAAPGAVLECDSILVKPVSGILPVTIRDLTIRGNGSGVGLALDSCQARIENVKITNFDVGLKLSFCLNTHIQDSHFEGATNALLCEGATNTTLLFTGSYFRHAQTAAKISAGIIDATFVQCIFEDSQRGLEADSIQNLSLYSCYFEACYQEQMVIGSVAQVNSVVITNPVMIGHANNDAMKDAALFDRVKNVTWLNGYCVAPKATIIKTTVNTENVFLTEPYHLGFARDIAKPERAVILLRDGYMQAQRFRSGSWSIYNTYSFVDDDMVIAHGSNIALHALPNGGVRLAGVNDSGLKRGMEIDEYGFTLTRESDGTRWRYRVGVDGQLIGVQV